MNDPVTPLDDDLPLAELTREELIALIESQREHGIRISFSGKDNARGLARRVRPRVTREVKKYGAGDEAARAENLLLEGDNLQAMATLYKLRGQVDLILTDPPYNTGNDWRYNDRWEEDPNDPGIGDFVSADDGARHTKWMRFMYPRLQMMKSMLRPGGVLAICIDHRELFRLGQLLDEVFRESNRLAIINWQKAYSPKNQETHVSTATEYVLVYAKDAERVTTGLLERAAETAEGYRNPDDDPLGAWTPSDSTLMGGPTHPGQVYGIQNPFTGRLHYPQEGRCWRNERAKMRAAVEEWGVSYTDVQLDDGCHPALLIKGARDPRGIDPASDPAVVAAQKIVTKRRACGAWPKFFWRDDRARRPGHGELRYKTYLAEVKAGVVPTTFWAEDDFDTLELGSASWPHTESGTSDAGQKELNAIVGRGHRFDTVKPLALFTRLISLWCPIDGLVLDPFAGSGTTGHAVLALNAESGSRRRFVLLEQGRPERGDSYARSLTAERLRRAVTGKWAAGARPALGGGFAFKRLDRKVDAPALLSMEREEMTDTVIASHFDATRRRGVGLCRLPVEANQYLVAKNTDEEGFFLVWGGPDANTDFTEDVYEAVAEEAERAGLKPTYHVYARLYLFQSQNVVFYQIPDRILRDFGLDLRGEPFSDD
ncbi:MAG TPA: site-specific DNA-methyltransferase [Mycobacteriales bacterium]|nr:site-specific DNA-methyltransferase [Mycobacteriales bacterium]